MLVLFFVLQVPEKRRHHLHQLVRHAHRDGPRAGGDDLAPRQQSLRHLRYCRRVYRVGQESDLMARAKATLQEEGRTDSTQPPSGENCNVVAQRIRLLHRVRCQADHAIPFEATNHRPHTTTGQGVHAGGRLIHEQDARLAGTGDRDAQPALHAAGVCHG